MIQFTGQVINGCLLFPPTQDALRGQWLRDSEGKFVKERLSRSGPAKTLNQVKAHFGLSVAMVRQQMIDLGWSICGIAPNKTMVHEILTKSCGGVGPLGETKRLREMTIDQAMKFFENIRDWSAQELHLVIPEPRKDWKAANDK